jgi:sulfite exporter TauE/SafE
MTELPLIVVGGLLGSTHCIGMCGPLALALGSQHAQLNVNLRRQIVFSLGRIFTYGFLGALAGFGGWWLADKPLSLVNGQAILSIAAGVVLLLLGLSTAGVLPRLQGRWLQAAPCTAAANLKSLLVSPGLTSALIAGVFTGFIPCGLVYAFLVYAAASGDLLHGAATMVAFGLGTIPLMVLAGCGGTLLSLSARARVLHLAAWCIVATGLISIARGAGHLQFVADSLPPGCPFCN